MKKYLILFLLTGSSVVFALPPQAPHESSTPVYDSFVRNRGWNTTASNRYSSLLAFKNDTHNINTSREAFMVFDIQASPSILNNLQSPAIKFRIYRVVDQDLADGVIRANQASDYDFYSQLLSGARWKTMPRGEVLAEPFTSPRSNNEIEHCIHLDGNNFKKAVVSAQNSGQSSDQIMFLFHTRGSGHYSAYTEIYSNNSSYPAQLFLNGFQMDRFPQTGTIFPTEDVIPIQHSLLECGEVLDHSNAPDTHSLTLTNPTNDACFRDSPTGNCNDSSAYNTPWNWNSGRRDLFISKDEAGTSSHTASLKVGAYSELVNYNVEYTFKNLVLEMTPDTTADAGETIPVTFKIIDEDTGNVETGFNYYQTLRITSDQGGNNKVCWKRTANGGCFDTETIDLTLTNGEGILYLYSEADALPANQDSLPIEVNSTILYGSDYSLAGAKTGEVFSKKLKETATYTFQKPLSYTIEITENKEFALLCEKPQFTFTVRDIDTNDVVTDEDDEIEIDITLPTGLTLGSVVTGTKKANGLYKPDKGVVVLELESDNYGKYTINAEVVDEDDAKDSAELKVVPAMLHSEPIYAVAEQATNFDVSVKACKSGTSATVTSYSGNVNINFAEMTLSQPTAGQGAIEGALSVANQSFSSSTTTMTKQLNFASGIASDVGFKYGESGAVSFEISDPNSTFTCPTDFDCTDANGEKWEGLEGIVNAYVRPWTFVICDESGNTPTAGTSSSGSGFKAAGENFTLRVKPIAYDSNGARCSSSAVTKNFFNSGAPSATVYLRGELHTPISGAVGTGSFIYKDDVGSTVSAGVFQDHDSNAGSVADPWYEFSNLYWNEVGSVKIFADINDVTVSGTPEYFNGVIGTGEQIVGRFYPHHLTIIEDSTLWQYDTHGHFAYMGQPIKHNFIIQAESSQTDKMQKALQTTNYGLFADSYKATIDYKSIINIPDQYGWPNWQSATNRLSATSLQWISSSWSGAQIKVQLADFIFKKNTATVGGALNLDGPFNNDLTPPQGIKNNYFGLVSNKVDGVDFKDLDFDAHATNSTFYNSVKSGKAFTTAPDLRYGRMTLTDVGGNQGDEITIPLRVEYWDGSQFVVSDSDIDTKVDSAHYCTKPIWSDATGTSGNVSLAGASSNNRVSMGKYDRLFASQNTARKEQYQVWLSLDTPSETTCVGSNLDQPWLRYYWSGSSRPEEDPSATVIFGTYRGNDRVIYRREP